MTDEQTRSDLNIVRITLKDLSFETPMGQAAYTTDWRPDYKAQLYLDSRELPDEQWEVILTAIITAELESKAAFLIEAQQSGVFTVTADNPEAKRRTLAIEAPKLIFPYLREAIDSVANKGGFPPVRMKPMDFDAWYEHVKKSKKLSDDEPVKASLTDNTP